MSGCYKIPIGAVPQATPGFIPSAIVQGPCCNTIYIEAIPCVDGPTSVWIPLNAVPSYPYNIKAGATCYVVSEGNTQTATPDGVILLTWSETSGCDDPVCGDGGGGGGGGDPICTNCGDCNFADDSQVTVSIPTLPPSVDPELVPEAITAINSMSKDLIFDHVDIGPIITWKVFSNSFTITSIPDDSALYRIELRYVLLCAMSMKAYIEAFVQVSTDSGSTWSDAEVNSGNPVFITTSSDTDLSDHTGDTASCTEFVSSKFYNRWNEEDVLGGDGMPIKDGESTASVTSNACE